MTYTIKTPHVLDSSSVHHKEFFTVHTVMVCVIQVWHTPLKLHMFQTVPLSILRSSSLYTQQWYMSYRYDIYNYNSTCFGQFLCPSSGVFHCTHSNGICHTGMTYTIKTLHVSDSSSVQHQEFFTVHTAMVHVIEVWHIPLLCVQLKTPDDGQRNCPNI